MKERNRYIVAAAKKWRPFDYGFTIDMLVLQLREMLKFYTDGKGVVQANESRDEIKAQLTKALQLYEEAADFENDEFIRLDDFCAEKGLMWTAIPAAQREAFQKADAQAMQAKYDAFFLYVSHHFREWWD